MVESRHHFITVEPPWTPELSLHMSEVNTFNSPNVPLKFTYGILRGHLSQEDTCDFFGCSLRTSSVVFERMSELSF